MKKLLFSGSVALLCVPGLALAAAYNDVTLDANAVVSVNGIAINVTGATLLNQIVVGATAFSVTLAPNSTISVKAPGGNQLVPAGGSVSQVTQRCDSGGSSLTLTSAAIDATTTITITPTATICSGSTIIGGGGAVSGGGGGGGGGGGSGYVAPAATPAAQTSAAGTGATSAPTLASLQAQLSALLAKLAAFKGGAAPSASAQAHANANASFKRDLSPGSTGADVKALQAWLNVHGFPVAASGAGASGRETTKFGPATQAALKAFQKSVGITPATGYLGPKTRSYIASH